MRWALFVLTPPQRARVNAAGALVSPRFRRCAATHARAGTHSPCLTTHRASSTRRERRATLPSLVHVPPSRSVSCGPYSLLQVAPRSREFLRARVVAHVLGHHFGHARSRRVCRRIATCDPSRGSALVTLRIRLARGKRATHSASCAPASTAPRSRAGCSRNAPETPWSLSRCAIAPRITSTLPGGLLPKTLGPRTRSR